MRLSANVSQVRPVMTTACDVNLLGLAIGGHLDEVVIRINGRVQFVAGSRSG